MIELNLLPEVKLQLVKAQRIQRIIAAFSVILSVAAVALVIALFSLNQIQKKHISDLNKDIATKSGQLKNDPKLKKILTVQNQLNSLSNLHSQKPAASRLFTYLNQVTPSDVSISNYSVDFNALTMTITGNGPSLSSVNKYVDTLKFTTFKTNKNNTSSNAFNKVVLSSFSVDPKAANPKLAATYTITMSYDKTIFDINQEVSLTVPQQTTTRSTTEQPTELFTTPKNGGN